METKNLLESIDKEINLSLRADAPIDIEKIVSSYKLDSKSKSILAQYISEVTNYHQQLCNKLEANIKDVMHGASKLGLVTSPMVGAIVGSAIGYFVGDWQKYAENGAFFGLLAEYVASPSAFFIGLYYNNFEAKKYEKLQETHRDLQRNKAIYNLKDSHILQ